MGSPNPSSLDAYRKQLEATGLVANNDGFITKRATQPPASNNPPINLSSYEVRAGGPDALNRIVQPQAQPPRIDISVKNEPTPNGYFARDPRSGTAELGVSKDRFSLEVGGPPSVAGFYINNSNPESTSGKNFDLRGRLDLTDRGTGTGLIVSASNSVIRNAFGSLTGLDAQYNFGKTQLGVYFTNSFQVTGLRAKYPIGVNFTGITGLGGLNTDTPTVYQQVDVGDVAGVRVTKDLNNSNIRIQGGLNITF